jgi:hypothetical protein
MQQCITIIVPGFEGDTRVGVLAVAKEAHCNASK